ncbi:hypothetical protein evm_002523 [Chilo suppressalis]|nr:hypothetical protein evm_002523 [Chilo suppressalis]
MVYSRQYNTRNSTGRYNNSGQFVAAGAPQQQQQPQYQQPAYNTQQFQPPPPPPQPQPPQQYQRNVHTINTQQQQFPKQLKEDMEMKAEPVAEAGGASGEESGPPRPHWMKSKLPGLKKISNREKRRRQNNHLRRLITPKNALMVLNEMLPPEQLASTLQQFTVEPADGVNQYYKSQKSSFCADLTLDGVNYKGYGENKIMARNAAAEQAIRDIIIKRMQKSITHDASSNADEGSSQAGAGAEGEAEGEKEKEEDPLPMIQLASYALHKLFSEWEYEGHKVSVDGPSSNSMHPIFTMSVDVDGVTYIGKASSKKEARKSAARSACSAIFGVKFDEVATANVPIAPSAPNANTNANANTGANTA